MVLAQKKQLQVRLAGFKSKIDKEGMKRLTVDVTLVETKGALRGELTRAVEVLQENPSLDGLTCDEKMEGIRLEFASPVTPGTLTQVFESTNLSSFTVGRERSTDAGTIEKQTSGRITVDFKFSPRVGEAGLWALENVGDELLMSIEKAQGELPLDTADEGPDSQTARNQRIEEAEAADAGEDAPPPEESKESEVKRPKRKKKAAKKL